MTSVCECYCAEVSIEEGTSLGSSTYKSPVEETTIYLLGASDVALDQMTSEMPQMPLGMTQEDFVLPGGEGWVNDSQEETAVHLAGKLVPIISAPASPSLPVCPPQSLPSARVSPHSLASQRCHSESPNSNLVDAYQELPVRAE